MYDWWWLLNEVLNQFGVVAQVGLFDYLGLAQKFDNFVRLTVQVVVTYLVLSVNPLTVLH